MVGSSSHVHMRRRDDGRRLFRDARTLAARIDDLRNLAECKASREPFGRDGEGHRVAVRDAHALAEAEVRRLVAAYLADDAMLDDKVARLGKVVLSYAAEGKCRRHRCQSRYRTRHTAREACLVARARRRCVRTRGRLCCRSAAQRPVSAPGGRGLECRRCVVVDTTEVVVAAVRLCLRRSAAGLQQRASAGREVIRESAEFLALDGRRAKPCGDAKLVDAAREVTFATKGVACGCGRWLGRMRARRHRFTRRRSQSCRDLRDRNESRIALSSLDTADEGPMHLNAIGEVFLRQALRRS